MEFVSLYPNLVPADRFIENLITLLSDGEYQAGALQWASPDEQLSPYALVSESAVWREDMEVPALLIKDVTTESKDDDGPLLYRTHRFSVYQMLADEGSRDGEARLKREAYRRATAVEMMIRSAHRSGYDLFDGMGISPGGVFIQNIRLSYGDTVPGRASYFRYPSVDVEIGPTRETQ